jgi:outer membrane protein
MLIATSMRMYCFRKLPAWLLRSAREMGAVSSGLFALLIGLALATIAPTQEIAIETPKPPPVVGPLLRPFHVERRIVSPAKLSNSPRIESLVRAGNLYLTAQDVVALALENNIDIAIQRYGPFLTREVLRRAQSGGFLRTVGVPVYAGPQSVSLEGVNVNTVGLAESGSGVGSGGGIVAQIGTPPPPLDPYLFGYVQFQHQTAPQSNVLLNETAALVNASQFLEFGYGQSFLTGTNAQLTYESYRSNVNSPANTLNPYTQGYLDLYVTQNLLQGLHIGVNNRNIRVAKNNMKVTDLQLRLQVITTISAVLNLYWDLVSFNEDLHIKEQAVKAAQKLYDDNKSQVGLGTLPGIEVTRAAAELSSSKESLLLAQTNVAQQETVLKNAISRNGAVDSWLDDVHIITVDHILVPEHEDLKPTAELIQLAIAQRPEVEQTRINLESSKINIRGTKDALLPTLQGFVELTNNGLTGISNALANGTGGIPDPYLVGGYGNLIDQIFRRNFPNYSAGVSLNIPFRNRQAQADYVTDQLSLRQGELQLQRSIKQVRVDVKNAVINLQQARVRYESASATRTLAQQSLQAEQTRFKFGQSTIPLVVQAQRDLALDQSAEVQSMANYTHAKIAFDEAVGQTLAANGVSMEEATSGKVARESHIAETPARPPAAANDAGHGGGPQ